MSDTTTVIRPSAVLTDRVAKQVLDELTRRDVSHGGLWSASVGLWQLYDKPWSDGLKGDSRLIGTIGTVYGTPSKYDITIYRVTITDAGVELGWTVESLCDEALQYGDLTLASCPRASLTSAAPDPFRRP